MLGLEYTDLLCPASETARAHTTMILADLDLGRVLHHPALIEVRIFDMDTADEMPVSVPLCQMLGHGGVTLHDCWDKKTRGPSRIRLRS
jgi:hypothetical protein